MRLPTYYSRGQRSTRATLSRLPCQSASRFAVACGIDCLQDLNYRVTGDLRWTTTGERGSVGAARLGILDFVEDAVDSAITSLIPVKTRALLPPRDDLWDALDPVLPPLQEGDVVAITSKVVAIHQGRCVRVDAVADKEELVA